MREDNVIVLVKRRQGWYADYQGPHSVAVARAFGTCMIPTGFTAAGPVETVVAAIAGLNPGVAIEVNRTGV